MPYLIEMLFTVGCGHAVVLLKYNFGLRGVIYAVSKGESRPREICRGEEEIFLAELSRGSFSFV